MDILQPPGWARPVGYSNGVKSQGEYVCIAGQVGWNESGKMVGDDLAAQVTQALRNVVAVLAEGGGAPEHIVRMTWYVTDLDDYQSRLQEIGRCYRAVMGYHYPAMSLVMVAGLLEEGAKVEIEATAVVPVKHSS